MSESQGGRSGSGGGAGWLGSWFKPWFAATVAATVVASAFDAALLHRRRSYFTGGFLSVDYISTPAQAVAFVIGSLASDFAVLGILVVVALWGCRRLGLSAKASAVLAFEASLVPIVVVNFLTYQLNAFLGDAFDFALMFQLAGRNPAEILAVSSSHIATALGAIAGGVFLLATMVWLHRQRSGPPPRWAPPTLRIAAVWCAILLLGGVVSTTVLRSSSDTLDNGLRRKPTGQLLGALVAATSDVDRDGFGLLGRLRDTAPLDASIHPFALDVPGNGIDEDAVGGDLPADLPPYREPQDSGPRWTGTPPIVLIALESFRADAFGASLAGRPVTPVLAALAASGATSAHAYSHNGYTVQSRQHLFSGSLAGLRNTTLIDDFNAQGYETGYFSGQDESFGGPGTDVGFSRAAVSYDARQDRERRYSVFSTPGSLAVSSDVLVERVEAFLKSRQNARPLFLYVNFHDTHFPYHHGQVKPLLAAPVLAQSEIAPERAADLRAMYLNTAANVDAAIGRVLDLVRTAVGSEPGVIVLSDHGESLFDEGFLGHGYALNDVQTRIPLVVSGIPLRIVEPFGQSDLRDALRAALAAPRGSPAPAVEQDPARRVFQYLGSIDSPAQIGVTSLSRRVLYDFRSQRARIGDSPWQRPKDLDPGSAREFVSLVQLWERMTAASRHGS